MTSNKSDSKRVDDGFLRKVIYILLASLITAVTSLIFLFGQVASNTEAIKKFDKYYESIVKIQVMVGQLVTNSGERNVLLKEVAAQQKVIFGEQQRRQPIIKRTQRHIEDKEMHK